MSEGVSRKEFEDHKRRINGMLGDMRQRVDRSERGSHPSEVVWRCDGCGELLMIEDTDTGEFRDQYGKRIVRVRPGVGTVIEVTCNCCARENVRAF